jgi:acyl-CoA thioesterase I
MRRGRSKPSFSRVRSAPLVRAFETSSARSLRGTWTARGYLLGMREANTLSYAALGDSTGVGVGARDGRGYVVRVFERIREREPGARLLNLCVSGATSTEVVRHQLPRALTSAPQLVSVFMGINDLVRGVAPATFARNVASVAEALDAQSSRALFCTLPDLTHAPVASTFLSALGLARTVFESRTLVYNEHVRHCAREHGHAVCDLFSVALRDRAHFFSDDGFHPASEGYEELAVLLWRELQPLLPASDVSG